LIVVAFLACQAWNGMGWLSWLEKLPEVYSLHLDNLSQSALLNPGWSLKVLISAAATLALLGEVVIYLASEKQYSTTGIPSSHLRVPVCRRFTLLSQEPQALCPIARLRLPCPRAPMPPAEAGPSLSSRWRESLDPAQSCSSYSRISPLSAIS
jgi:hypothetical protein